MVFRTELTVVVEDGVVQDIQGLPDGWTYEIDDHDTSGFDIGVYREEQGHVQ